MPTLKPYYYNDGGISTVGYPTSTNSAIYSNSSNWIFAPIFRNSLDVPIVLKSLGFYCGINTGSAIGNVCFSSLGDSIYSTTNVSNVSNQFNIPVTTSLNPTIVNLYENYEVVIPPHHYFSMGVSVKRTIGNGYLSIACARNNDSYRSFYFAQSITDNVSNTLVRLVESSDVNKWNFTIPYMYVNYELYKIRPIVNNDNVTISQGDSVTVLVSSYGDWSIGAYDSDKLSCTKSDDGITISAKYFNAPSKTSTNVTLIGLDDNTTINVNITPPSINTPIISNTKLRPMESADIVATTSDGLSCNISINNVPGVTLNSNKVSVSAITKSSTKSGWQTSVSGTDYVNITLTHPKNSAITLTIPNAIKIEHYNSSDILFRILETTSSKTKSILNNIGSSVSFRDTTVVSGKCLIDSIISDGSNYTNNFEFNYTTGQIILKETLPTSSSRKYAITCSLKNDSVVTSKAVGDIQANSTLGVSIFPTYYNTYGLPKLPLFMSDEDGKLKVSPYNYPIIVQYPTTLLPITKVDKDGYTITRTDAIITNLRFVGVIGSGAGETEDNIDTTYHDNLYWISDLINSPIKLGETYTTVIGEKPIKISKTMNQLLSYTYVEVRYDVIYRLGGSEQTTAVKLRFDLYKDRIYTFYNNKYINGDKIQGSSIVLPLAELSNDTINEDSAYSLDTLINCLRYPLYSILSIYDLMPINGVSDREFYEYLTTYNQIIHANKGDYVSNESDVVFIEKAIARLNMLINSIMQTSSKRCIVSSRAKVAKGECIMWDDSVDKLADGRTNTFKNTQRYLTETASPFKELFDTIDKIQYLRLFNIKYRDADKVYKIKYRPNPQSVTEYDVGIWR